MAPNSSVWDSAEDLDESGTIWGSPEITQSSSELGTPFQFAVPDRNQTSPNMVGPAFIQDSVIKWLNGMMGAAQDTGGFLNDKMQNDPLALLNPPAMFMERGLNRAAGWATEDVPNQSLAQSFQDMVQLPLNALGMIPGGQIPSAVGSSAVKMSANLSDEYRGYQPDTLNPLKSPSTPTGAILDAATNAGAMLVPDALGGTYRGARSIGPKKPGLTPEQTTQLFDDPLYQDAAKVAGNKGFFSRGNSAERVNRKGKITDDAYRGLKVVEEMSKDYDPWVAELLDIGKTEGNVDTVLQQKITDRMPAIKKTGLLEKATTPEDLGMFAGDNLKQMDAELNTLVEKLDNETAKHDVDTGGVGKRGNRFKVSTISKGDVDGLLKDMESDAVKSDLMPFGKGAGEAIRATKEAIETSFTESGQRYSPGFAIRVHQHLTKLKEALGVYDTTKQAGIIRGDSSKLYHDAGMSIQKITKFQEELASNIDAKIQIQKKRGVLPQETRLYADINDEYSATSVLKQVSDNAKVRMQAKRNKVGETPPEGLAREQGESFSIHPGSATSNPWVSSARTILENINKSGTSPALLRGEAGVNEGPRAMSDINSLFKLQAGGFTVPERSMQPRLPDLQLPPAAGGAMNAVGNRAVMQAQEPQPFPRDTNYIRQHIPEFYSYLVDNLGVPDAMADDAVTLLSSNNPEMQAQGMAELSKSVPGLFEHGSYSSEMDGRIMDPGERGLHANQLKVQRDRGQMDAKTWAKSLSDLNRDGSINPPSVQQQMPNMNQGPNSIVSGYDMTPMGRARQYDY